MPYSTTGNSGWGQAANTIAKLFVGDPAADAEYRDREIRNETEFLRQKNLQERALSEAVRRKQLEAQAAANQAQADLRNQELNAKQNLGEVFTRDYREFNEPGGMSVPGDAPIGTPGAGFTLDKAAPDILSNVFTGGIDPNQLSAMAIMPGMEDNDLGRLMVGAGNFIGDDDYVSLSDRNNNRRFDVGANERLVDDTGRAIVGVDPSYADPQAALANQRNATAAFQDRRTGGGKIPKLDQREMNRFIREALMTRGAEFPVDPETNQYQYGVAEYLSGQPDLYQNFARLIDEAYSTSGGRASAVQDALSQYLEGADFGDFRQVGTRGFDGLKSGEVAYNPVNVPDLDTIIAAIQEMYGPQSAQAQIPAVFSEGGNQDLQNRQNVGNTNGWKVIGVE